MIPSRAIDPPASHLVFVASLSRASGVLEALSRVIASSRIFTGRFVVVAGPRGPGGYR